MAFDMEKVKFDIEKVVRFINVEFLKFNFNRNDGR